ncbi:transposase [Kitasatospora sp. NPDC048298]|uniref:transposase n=1 Tax=Kitasatospora sp. NPDC048298 TaxID=3364049 RepID=UPI00371F7C6D
MPALRAIYTAPTEQALDEFAASELGERYPAVVRTWRAAWSEFTPYLAFPPAIRTVVYSTNMVESINSRLRKATRNRGHFPSEQAALKVLYLARPGADLPQGKRHQPRRRTLEGGAEPVLTLLRGPAQYPITARHLHKIAYTPAVRAAFVLFLVCGGTTLFVFGTVAHRPGGRAPWGGLLFGAAVCATLTVVLPPRRRR